jgi:hypothetical protein
MGSSASYGAVIGSWKGEPRQANQVRANATNLCDARAGAAPTRLACGLSDKHLSDLTLMSGSSEIVRQTKHLFAYFVVRSRELSLRVYYTVNSCSHC